MKLSDYLHNKKIDETAFAAMLGVSAKAVRHWLEGIRTPRPSQMRNIVDVTGGAVTPNDFLPSTSPELARPFTAAPPQDCEAAE